MANYDPVQVSLNNSPRAVVQALDDLVARRTQVRQASAQRRPLLRVLPIAGLALIVIDLLAGYASHFFLLTGLLVWVIAFVVWLRLRRASIANDFSPRYQLARRTLSTPCGMTSIRGARCSGRST